MNYMGIELCFLKMVGRGNRGENAAAAGAAENQTLILEKKAVGCVGLKIYGDLAMLRLGFREPGTAKAWTEFPSHGKISGLSQKENIRKRPARQLFLALLLPFPLTGAGRCAI